MHLIDAQHDALGDAFASRLKFRLRARALTHKARVCVQVSDRWHLALIEQ